VALRCAAEVGIRRTYSFGSRLVAAMQLRKTRIPKRGF
jgi:hypothetical protein